MAFFSFYIYFQLDDTPLIQAASIGHTDVVKILIEYGAEVDALDKVSLDTNSIGGDFSTFIRMVDQL